MSTRPYGRPVTASSLCASPCRSLGRSGVALADVRPDDLSATALAISEDAGQGLAVVPEDVA